MAATVHVPGPGGRRRGALVRIIRPWEVPSTTTGDARAPAVMPDGASVASGCRRSAARRVLDRRAHAGRPRRSSAVRGAGARLPVDRSVLGVDRRRRRRHLSDDRRRLPVPIGSRSRDRRCSIAGSHCRWSGSRLSWWPGTAVPPSDGPTAEHQAPGARVGQASRGDPRRARSGGHRRRDGSARHHQLRERQVLRDLEGTRATSCSAGITGSSTRATTPRNSCASCGGRSRRVACGEASSATAPRTGRSTGSTRRSCRSSTPAGNPGSTWRSAATSPSARSPKRN